ncbi:MAG: VCBS domain-containing protein [Hyphomicrobiales bacterium]
MVKVDYAFSESSAAALLAQGGPVTVPDAHLLFGADFSRAGHDLLLTGDDGKTLTIVDYFGPHGPVNLVSPDGAVLSSSVVQSLAGPLAPGQYAQAGDQQPAEAIGKVVTLQGPVSAQHTDGTVVQLAIGDPVAMGDVLQTGSGASVGLVFTDGTVFNLSNDSRMVLDNLVYQPGGSSNALNFNIVQGTFSFVAGQIAPTGEMRIDTPVATMGIRGTAPMGICSNGGPCKFILVPNPGDGHIGQYLLFATGTNNLIATVNTTDLQYTVFANGGYETGAIDPDFKQELQNLIDAFEHKETSVEPDEPGGNGSGETNHAAGGSGIGGAFTDSPIEPNAVDAFAAFVTSQAELVSEAIQSGAETVTTTDAGTGVVDTSSPPVIVQNQPPTFGGQESGDAVEDVGTSTGGTVVVTDPDGGGESGVQPQTATQGTYGVFSILADGTWTYTLNNGSAAVQSLPDGTLAHDVFIVVSADGTATTSVDITVTGTNDIPTITGTATGDVGEDGTATATGTIAVSDPDTGESSVIPQSGVAGTYGTFAITAAGVWTYVLDNANAAVQALPQGATLTETFNVTSADGTTTQSVTVTITGSNDGPTIGGVDTGSVTENSETTSVQGALTISDPDTGESVFQTQSGTLGQYGSFTVDQSGNWTYTLNNGNAAVDGLNVGDSLTDSFTVLAADGTQHVVTVTINGSNDAAVLTPAVANLAETNSAADISTGGTLPISDVDSPATFVAQTGTEGAYGTFSIDANGVWTYTADSAHNEFLAGQTYTDSFTVTAADGTQTTVTVNILGTNDVAEIGGVSTGSVTEDTAVSEGGDLTAQGSLTITDPDSGQAAFVAQASVAGTYGTFTLDAAGNWTYTADNSQQAIQQLGANQSITDSFTAVSADGTDSQVITVTIHGTNDGAEIGGVSTGSVTEDVAVTEEGDLATQGSLTIADPDSGQAAFVAQASVAGTYGTFTLDAAGNWTYTADNSQQAIQQLGANQSITDSFTAVSADGTDSQVITVTIDGTNDGAEIGGVSTGSVTEDVAVTEEGDLTTQGSLTIADPDSGQAAFVAQASVAGTYGTFTLDSAGNWTYTADNGQQAIQQLGANQSITDSFTAVSADGTDSQVITVTIHGSNDGAEIGGVSTGSVTEDVTVGEGQLNSNGQLTIIDPDSGQAAFVAQASVAGTYGTFTLDAAGNWTYTADNSQQAIQELGANQSITDSFTAVSADGTDSQVVTVTIHGTNDGAEIGGVSTGSVTEDVTVGEGQLYSNGQLTITDPDSGQAVFVARERCRDLAVYARCGRQLDLHRRQQPGGDPAAWCQPVDHRQLRQFAAAPTPDPRTS